MQKICIFMHPKHYTLFFLKQSGVSNSKCFNGQVETLSSKPPLYSTSYLLILRSAFFELAVHEGKGELGGCNQLGISYMFSTCLSLSD